MMLNQTQDSIYSNSAFKNKGGGKSSNSKTIIEKLYQEEEKSRSIDTEIKKLKA